MSELFDLPSDGQESENTVPENEAPATAADPVPEKAAQEAPKPAAPAEKSDAPEASGETSDKAKPYMVLARKTRVF